MTHLSYDLSEPDLPSCGVVFASPHSGRRYGAAFLQQVALDPHTLRSSEDAWVDGLIAPARGLGIPVLTARTPRAFVDLNRSVDELDPALIDGLRRNAHNPRVTSGLGVVPRVVANGRAIYRGRLPLAEARRRINEHWHPYHDTLLQVLERQRARFGRAILIDCHSMPHEAIEGHCQQMGRVPDVVLGDRFGTSSAPDVMAVIEEVFDKEGFTVARNTPFAGAYIAQHYGQPALNQHVVQIEVDRSLYMDEATLKPHAGFDKLRGVMERVAEAVGSLAQPQLPLAAE